MKLTEQQATELKKIVAEAEYISFQDSSFIYLSEEMKRCFDESIKEYMENFVKEYESKEPTKHICFEASHIECSCKDKCLRNINNY